MLLLGAGGLLGAAIYGYVANSHQVVVEGRLWSCKAPCVLSTSGSDIAINGATGSLIALVILLGALAVGAFVGFLFGLPRTLTSNELRANRQNWGDLGKEPSTNTDKPGGGTEATGAVANAQTGQTKIASGSYTDVNTNLEQISDWLTKIIVGIGLTEIRDVPGRLDSFGTQVADYFGFGGYAFGVGGGLAALIYGFFLSYVGTRVRLSLVFTRAQRFVEDGSRGMDTNASGKSLGDATAPRNAATIATANEIVSRPLTELTTKDELVARADALFQLNDAEGAVTIYREALKMTPLDTTLLGKLAAALAAAGRQGEADSMLGTVKSLGTGQEVIVAKREVTVSGLRKTMHDGVNLQNGLTPQHALVAGEELLKIDPAQAEDVWVQIWLACAYAYGFKLAGLDDPGKADLKAKAIAAVTKAVKLDPAKRSYLASLYDPDKVQGADDDLVPLFGDPELNMLLL